MAALRPGEVNGAGDENGGVGGQSEEEDGGGGGRNEPEMDGGASLLLCHSLPLSQLFLLCRLSPRSD